jgi:hypothetical protein
LRACTAVLSSGAGDDLEVQQQGPVAQVFQVVFDALGHLVEGVGFTAAAVDLGPAGDARAHLVTHHVGLDELAVLLVVGHRVRARADDAHAALQHVEELGQFVQRAAAQEGAEGGDARVVFAGLLHDRAVVHGGHGAELVDGDLLAVQAVAALFEDGRAGRGGLDADGDDGQQRSDEQQDEGGQDEVAGAFDQAVDADEGAFQQAHHGHAVHVVHAALDDVDAEDVRHEVHGGRAVLQLAHQAQDARLPA